MNQQSLFVRLAGGLSLMVALSACGKNLSVAVPGNQAGKETQTSKDNQASKDNLQKIDIKDEVENKPADGVKPAEAVASATMDDVGVLNPLSRTDIARLIELRTHFGRNTDDEEERKTARVIFKTLNFEALELKTTTVETPVVYSSGKKKGQQKVDSKTGKPMVTTENQSTSGTLEMVLTLNEKDHAYDTKNFKICLFADMGESDRCITYAELKKIDGAIVNNPIVDAELKINLMAAFGLSIASVFEITDEVNLASGAESKYFRKLLLSFNGVKTAVGAKLDVISDKRADATVNEAEYKDAILENIAADDMIPSRFL